MTSPVVMVMATSSGRCYTTALLLASFWLLTTAGDVNYRDVVIGRKSSFMSQYFRRLYRRQRHCEEPELTERVRLADVVLTGTIRALEVDAEQPDCEVARVEVKRVIKESSRRQVCTEPTHCSVATMLILNYFCLTELLGAGDDSVYSWIPRKSHWAGNGSCGIPGRM